MNIFKLSVKNIVDRPLNTFLSLLLLALGVGLISLVLHISTIVEEQFEKNIKGIDMVTGAKGSPLQLILSSVLHIDDPTGNIELVEAKKLMQHPLVKKAIPLSYGDSHKGYRIVGTERSYLDLYEAKVAKGKIWEKSFEVTVGASVAKVLELDIGDHFFSTHGLVSVETAPGHEEHPFTVVGVLEPTNSVIDQLILTSLESVWEVHDHGNEHQESDDEHEKEEHMPHDDHEMHEEEHNHRYEEDKEITALLVKFRSPLGTIQIPRQINENTNMQAAVPSYEISRLFNLLGIGVETLKVLALAIILVSGISVFISLYNSLKERVYEMALMRTFGASKWQVFTLVVNEGLILSFLGFVFGTLGCYMALAILSHLSNNSFVFSFLDIINSKDTFFLFLLTIGVGVFSSIIPAFKALRVNISKTLGES